MRQGLRYLLSGLRSKCSAALAGYNVGERTVVHRCARVEPRGGRIQIGSDCAIHEFACLYGSGGFVALGDRVAVHPFSILYGDGGVTIGNHVQISAHVVIVSDNLRYKERGRFIDAQGRDRNGIVVEDDVWIGAHAVILDGVRIARGGVIAAGAIVATSTIEYGVYAGVPARQIGARQ